MTVAELLANLPASLSRCVLSQWLNVRSLAHLDKAYCSHIHRKHFLKLLHNCDVSFPEVGIADPQHTLITVRWLFSRHLKCTYLSMAYYMPYPTEDVQWLHSYLQRAASYLKYVCFTGDLDALLIILELLASTSCSLTRIDLGSGDESVSVAIQQSHLKTVLLNSALVLQDFRSTIITDWPSIFVEDVYFPALVKLSVSVASDSNLVSICKIATNLREITLNGEITCSNVGISAIGQYCHHLESLSMNDLDRIENIDQGFIALAAGCPKLKILRMHACSFLSDVGLMAIAQHCTHLEELRIFYNDFITDASLVALANNVGANLKVLCLDDNDTIGTGEGILATAKQCPYLHTVAFSYLDFAAEDNLLLALPYWKNVKTLRLNNCPFCDNVLYAIAEHLPLLEELSLGHKYHSFTVTAVTELVQYCKMLKVLDFEYSHYGVNRDVVAQWQATRPGLIVIPADCE